MARSHPRILALLSLTAVAAMLATAGPALAQSVPGPAEDRAKGVVLDGLTPAPGGPCNGGFELAYHDKVGTSSVPLCTHGPDPAPDGVDVSRPRPTAELKTAAETLGGTIEGATTPGAQAGIPCYGTGTDGYRVHIIFARASNVADRYPSLASSLVTWAAATDQVVSTSAAETGGVRHIRFVTDAACNLVVDRVTLSATGDDNLNNTISELRAQGYNRADRKYLVFADANIYCGIGQIYGDDTASATPGVNYNNGNPGVPGLVARVDSGCWGMSASVEAHELMHNLGGVQSSAPHVTPNSHCTDEYDRMCYVDGAGVTMQFVCPASHEARFDCNHDDYFSTNPPAGSYLATHWNTANSAFLARTEPFPDRAWGMNAYGQLGDGSTVDRTTATVNGLAPVDAVAAGGYHSLAVSGGTVWSWGLGHVGQLGRGIIVSSATPAPVPGLSNVTAVAGGMYHSLALRSDGTVWSWGWNLYGMLGDGTTIDRSAPVQVTGLTGVVAISAGITHSMALKSDGTVWNWGLNNLGQMGRSTPFTALTAGAVPGLTGITSIAAGGYHSLAVRANGTVAAWGYNIWGQVGDGTILDQWTPVTVPGLSGVRSVAAGIGHSLALGTDGTVRSWGLAHVGQLGRLAVLPLLSPSPAVIPGLTGVTKISGGGYHSLALLASGTVVGWGWNAYGQLGDGSLLDRLGPVAVAGLVGVTSISAGVAHDLVAGA
ncbi:MAG: hypothetical protein QOE93_2176 [Actinomycetota bacterium]|jgi:alpha-tubulin suppressor-like RCC1 family protein|nr:hypothetical protein [Actinomycetota bacterium]